MLKNYLKIALRVIRKRKLYSLLNIVGLAVSLTCSFLILLHVKDELSYETYFPQVDRIYRVQVNSKYGTNFRNWAASAPALGPMLEESFPEIDAAIIPGNRRRSKAPESRPRSPQLSGISGTDKTL